MGLYAELQTLDREALMQCFQSPPPEGEEYAAGYYLEVAERISACHEKGGEFLRQQLNHPDVNRARAALFALSLRGESHETVPLLLRYLHDPRPLMVAEALDGLRHHGDQTALQHAVPLVSHTSPPVVSAVLRYLSAFDRDRAVPLLLQGLQHPDVLVRENACDELGDLEVLEAIPALLPLLDDPHPHVRQAAQTSIEDLRRTQKVMDQTGMALP